MNTHDCHCQDDYQGHLTSHHRVAWRNAVAALVSPMVRLHQLRNVRTRMLHEALCDLDHCDKRDRHA